MTPMGVIFRSAFTAQRIAHTLGRLGYLEHRHGGYVPGSRLLDRTFDYLRANPLVGRAIPILTELRRNVMERVDMSLFEDLTLLYAIRLQSKRIHPASTAGRVTQRPSKGMEQSFGP
jgi:IclR family transcriptional regulator, pca regulon regulatory protein